MAMDLNIFCHCEGRRPEANAWHGNPTTRLRRPSASQRREKGQTTLEYLMLMSLAFITAYLIMTVGIGPFTRNMVFGIRLGLLNVIQNAELSQGAPATPGQAGHPSDQTRFRALHL